MKKLYILLVCITFSCCAMLEEEEKKEILCALRKLNTSSKYSDFFAFYDLFFWVKNPDQPVSKLHKAILQEAGLLNGDELKPLVSGVFLEFARKDDFENTLLLPMDIE